MKDDLKNETFESALQTLIKNHVDKHETAPFGEVSWSQCAREHDGRMFRVIVGEYGKDPVSKIQAINQEKQWRIIPWKIDTSNPPFDGSEVLIWGEGQDGAYLAIYEADTNEPWKIADTHPSGWTPLVDAPTHWMPLPAPPESEADRD